MSEMIERVADGLYPLMHESDPDHIRAIARAAIEAMHEPTEEMLRVGGATIVGGTWTEQAKFSWDRMINAALGEPDR